MQTWKIVTIIFKIQGSNLGQVRRSLFLSSRYSVALAPSEDSRDKYGL